MTSEDDVKQAMQVVSDKFGRLDLAVSCAGIGVAVVTYNAKKDRIHRLEEFQKVINVGT